MKGERKVTSNPIGGKTLYGVYRLLDINEVDHSGNREFVGDYVEDKSIAEFVAKQLNGKEKSPLKAD